jgi:hypothetical protein
LRKPDPEEDDLFIASRRGDLERVKYLVEIAGASLNEIDEWNGTALYYACLTGSQEVALYLLERGARCFEKTFDGERCFYAAHDDAIRSLLHRFQQVGNTFDRHDSFSRFWRHLHLQSLDDFANLPQVKKKKKKGETDDLGCNRITWCGSTSRQKGTKERRYRVTSQSGRCAVPKYVQDSWMIRRRVGRQELSRSTTPDCTLVYFDLSSNSSTQIVSISKRSTGISSVVSFVNSDSQTL